MTYSVDGTINDIIARWHFGFAVTKSGALDLVNVNRSSLGGLLQPDFLSYPVSIVREASNMRLLFHIYPDCDILSRFIIYYWSTIKINIW